MVKRKERNLKELYTVTHMILQPEITPILKGSCRIQGPVDESDQDIQTNMVSSRADKGYSRRPLSNQKVHIRSESGTCNVCSAPCSSCMHITRSLMGSKTGESSDDENATSQHSINDGCSLPNTSSVNSGHDSLSENAHSKANLRTIGGSNESEDVKMAPASSTGVTASPDKLPLKGIEGHDDNILCARGANKNLPFTSGSGSSLDKESLVTAIRFQTELDLSEVPSSQDTDAGKSYVDPSVKASEEVSCSNIKEEVPECSREHINLSVKKEETSHAVNSFEALMVVHPKIEIETGKDSDEPPDEVLKSSDQNVEADKVKESLELLDMQGHPSVSQLEDESDESDMVEHDVKVCDICGDAGREDCLAICSRCIDGAEHIYCMRERLLKVPEGDWLCEECKLEVENEARKKDKLTKTSNDMDVKDSDVDETRNRKTSSSTQICSKRHAENIEVAPLAKRQALEMTVGSPKPSSPSGIVSTPRESSFKSLDKGKVNQAYQTSFGTQSKNDAAEAALFPTSTPRIQNPRGTLLKSNSFSTFNTKTKVKVVDEVVTQKQRSAREPVSLDRKEGHARILSKSMSFKAPNSSRSNASESKVKMLSPNFSYTHDKKGLKQQAKGKSSFERKIFKPDHSLASSKSTSLTISSPNADKKLASHIESVSVSTTSNNRDLKTVQTDGKLTTPKSASQLPPKGEMKRQSSFGPNSSGSSSTNATGSGAEQKPNQIAVQEEPLSSYSRIAERPLNNVGESTSQSEKMKENAVSRPRPTLPADGRSAQFLTVGSPRVSAADGSAGSSLKEIMNKGSNLKAAIEAAILKKPGLSKRTKVLDHPEELSMSKDSNSEVASQEQLSITNYSRNMLPGKHSVKDLPAQHLAAKAVLQKTFIIPEHEYIWQGGLELYRNGKPPELCGGVQAHLSTCASPKVLEVVNKFPSRVPLTEVPRLSTWPLQFQEIGVKEDNIALYFFARDFESYERYYRHLVESMMKDDLALKGNSDGVELLIFPSNQLPEGSKRWNRLYYLWGVFRAKRGNCTTDISGSSEKPCIPISSVPPINRDISTPAISLPENNMSSFGHLKNGSSNLIPLCKVPAPVGLSIVQPSEKINGVCDTKTSSAGQMHLEQQDSGYEFYSTSSIQEGRVHLFPKITHPCISPRDNKSGDISFEATAAINMGCEKDQSMGVDNVEEKIKDIEVIKSRRDERVGTEEEEHMRAIELRTVGEHDKGWDLNAKEEALIDLTEDEPLPPYNSYESTSDKAVILENSGSTGKLFFPRVRVGSPEDESVPDLLKLALGPVKQEVVLPLFSGLIDKSQDSDEVAASLSLSLSFPSLDKEASVVEAPEKQDVNTSLLLFRGFSEK